jgi:hypothetical protein
VKPDEQRVVSGQREFGDEFTIVIDAVEKLPTINPAMFYATPPTIGCTNPRESLGYYSFALFGR